MKLPGPVRFVVGMLLAAGLVEGALFVGVPALVSAMVPGIARTELGRTARIGEVTFNPFTLTLAVRDIQLFSGDNQSVEIGLKRVEVDVSAASLRKGAPVVESLFIDGLEVSLSRNDQGRLSIDDILEKLAEKPASPEPALYALNNVRVRSAAFNWRDALASQSLDVRNIELDLPFLSTLPSDVKIAVQPHLRAEVASGELQLRVSAKPFDENLSAQLSVNMQKFPLALLQPWLPKTAGVTIAAGELDTSLEFEFSERFAPQSAVPAIAAEGAAASEGSRKADMQRSLAVSGTVHVTGFKSMMMLPVTNPAAQVPKLPDIPLDIPETKIELDKLVLLSPVAGTTEASAGIDAPAMGKVNVSVQTSAYGAFSAQGQASVTPLAWKGGASANAVPLTAFAQWLPASPVSVLGGVASAQADLQCARPAASLDCVIAAASLKLSGLRIAEHSGAGGSAPVEWAFPSVRLTASDIKPGGAQPFLYALNVALPNVPDALESKGRITLSPLGAQSTLRLNQFPLPLLQPYLAAFTTGQLTRGALDIDSQIGFENDAISVNANVGVSQFRFAPTRTARSVLKLENLSIKGVEANASVSGLQRIGVNGVKVAGLNARIERDSEGRLNWEQLLQPANRNGQAAAPGRQEASGKSGADVAASAVSKPAAALAPVIEVGVIEVERTNVSFSDAAVTPSFNAELTNLKGQMSAFSTLASRRSTVEMTGGLDGDGLLVISGQVDPVNPRNYLNINLRARGIEMTRLSPYSARYAGYNIAKGKLSTSLNYRIENGQLVAENSLFLDQLNFGDAVQSPDATTLPVRLAVALLKNLKGEIDLNLPVKGSLNDPQFSIGEVVFKALGNVIVKAVSAPFRLVASLFEDEEEFAGSLDFDAGVAKVPDDAQKQLKSLVNMLSAKPDLELEVTGYADLLTDSAGLQQIRKRTDAVSTDDIRRLAYERAVAAKNAIVELKPELSDRIFLVAPTREQLGQQAENPRRAVDFAVR